MSYSLQFHKLVQQDFSDAYEWYENKSQGLGERFVETVKQKLDVICNLPERMVKNTERVLGRQKLTFFLL